MLAGASITRRRRVLHDRATLLRPWRGHLSLLVNRDDDLPAGSLARHRLKPLPASSIARTRSMSIVSAPRSPSVISLVSESRACADHDHLTGESGRGERVHRLRHLGLCDAGRRLRLCRCTRHDFPGAERLEARRQEAYQGFLELVARAKATGHLHPDFASEDLVLLLMANAGVTAATLMTPLRAGADSSVRCCVLSRLRARRRHRSPDHHPRPTSSAP